jgi:hypothetical protein
MKSSRSWRSAALIACLAFFASAVAIAQDHTRNWENGYVIGVSEIHVKDGMMNAYINDLNTGWRKFLEAQKADGDVISYGMYVVANPREGEPNLILTVTYKNWATFDRGEEYFEKLGEKIFGSDDNMRKAGIKRGELRTFGSNYTLQEIKFKE